MASLPDPIRRISNAIEMAIMRKNLHDVRRQIDFVSALIEPAFDVYSRSIRAMHRAMHR